MIASSYLHGTDWTHEETLEVWMIASSYLQKEPDRTTEVAERGCETGGQSRR
jgi:hypothetical protein